MVCDASRNSKSQENGLFYRIMWPGLIGIVCHDLITWVSWVSYNISYDLEPCHENQQFTDTDLLSLYKEIDISQEEGVK